jgi:hypothetical protein
MSICTNEKLVAFGWKHYAYINQIFGTPKIRSVIMKIYPSELKLKYEKSGPEFENSHHHFVYNPRTNQRFCSVDSGYQNEKKDENDNLCQSYSLLTYFGIPISKTNKIKRQMDMIYVYRTILSDERFVKALDSVIYPGADYDWEYDTGVSGEMIYDIPMNKQSIIQNILSILDEWEEYGYNYFIGDGTCPKADNKRRSKRSRNRNPTASYPLTRAHKRTLTNTSDTPNTKLTHRKNRTRRTRRNRN